VLDGRYRIDAVIGQGGMATVYRAHDVRVGRDVAVKLFPPTPDSDELLRHQSEISVLAHVDHPGLVALHDAGYAYAGGAVRQTYIVMELVPGPSLADLVATGPLSPAHTARLGRQLAEAVDTVHRAGVVHRDIKPANILLVERGTALREDPAAALETGPVVKLADFGIARFADGARLTMTGTTLGTATYLSPEQAMGGEVGAPTDVYALGLVLLECLTGEKAFTGTVAEVAAARLARDPAIPEGLGEAWVSLLRDMTRREPGDRVTMTDVAARLAPLGAQGPDAGPAPSPVLTAPVLAPQGRPAPSTAHGQEPVPTRRVASVTEVTQPVAVDAPRLIRPRAAHRPVRLRAVVAGLLVLVALAAVAVVLGVVDRPVAPDGTREYPAIEGELGRAVDQLVRSVDP